MTPPAFEHVVRVCLAKDPDRRWQSAHDVAAELRWIAEAGSQAGVAAPLTAAAAPPRAALAGGALGARGARRRGWHRGVSRCARTPDAALRLDPAAAGSDPAADRRRLRRAHRRPPTAASSPSPADKRRQAQSLWLRRLDEPSAHPIEGTEAGQLLLLVARQPLDRLLRQRQAAPGRRGRRARR